ncbi:hypothetical protein ACWD3I_19300 [Streptomyces sp. NPDC002817]|uniref:hypothetical protein n=1 Tax=Streptomyces sp. NPDC088357 TaxID=3154655 RepID=UPI0034325477
MGNRTETACRICGYDDSDALFDQHGVPQYVICPCCGNESGIGDDSVSQVRELRGLRVATGARWAEPGMRPDDWDVLRQMTAVPPPWR